VSVTDILRAAFWAAAATAFTGMLITANRRGARFWVYAALTLVAAAVAGNHDLSGDTPHSLLHR